MASQLEVDLIVKAISQGFEKVSADLAKTGGSALKAGEEAGKAGMSFTELNQALEVGQKAASAFFGTFEKVFELGKAGSEAIQTAESFDYLLKTVGAAPDLLDQLRAAARGTVDDLKLMSSTSVLLAGATGQLATDLANATPELLNIAKAAQKLNPTLGDTTFMYESLALGIKRASPLILDNLGLTIKVEEANKKYADTLGKNANQLTATEAKQALLSATLEAGRVLIDQVGGSTDSATDSIARMETSIKNTSDALKAQLAPSINNVADAITVMLTAGDKIEGSFKAQAQTMLASGKSYEEYRSEMIRAAQASGYFVQEVDGVIKVSNSLGDINADTAHTFAILSEAAYEASGSMDMNERVTAKLAKTDKELSDATDKVYMAANGWAQLAGGDLPDALYQNEEAAQAVIDKNRELEESQNDLAISAAGLAAGLAGDLQGAMEDYQETMGELVAESQALNEELAVATSRYGEGSEQVAELTAALEENANQQMEAAEALRVATAEMIYQQAAAGLDNEAALDLARSMGLLSEQDYVVASSLEAMRQAFDANRDGAISAAEGADEYARRIELMYKAILDLQSKNIPITFENLKKAMEELAAAAGSEDAQNAGEAAQDVAEGVENAGEASEDAEGSMEDAANSMDKMGDSADDAIDPVNKLGDALNKLPKSVNVRVTQTGAAEVLKLIHDIRDAIAELPARKEVNIIVNAEENQPQGQGNENMVGGGGANRASAGGPGVEINNTYNVYDQMAGELLLEQQRLAASGRAEELMNGA